MNKTYQVPLKYSQNFLKDQFLIRDLIKKSGITNEDTVLDIGAGNGIISEELAKVAKKVIAIEKDKQLYNALRQAQGDTKEFQNVEILNVDFLEYKIPSNLKYKVFSNIPFSITAEITRKLFLDVNPPVNAFLIMQREVALKFLGEPKETVSSLLVKPFFDVKSIYNFKRDDFFPVPSVEISMVSFIKKQRPQIESQYHKLYREFIIYSFNQWKENLWKSLRKIFSNLQFKILSETLAFRIDAKPSDLSVAQWVSLFNYFKFHIPPYKQKLVRGSEELLGNNQQKMRKEQFKRYGN